MSQATNQFLDAAKAAKITDEAPRITYEGQSTFMKFCSVCFEIMPHIRRDDHSECAVCGLKTFKHESGQSLLEIAFWIAVVVFVVLVVLKDKPW